MTLQDKKIALIGCGDIGCRLGRQLLALGAEVHGMRRSLQHLPAGFIAHALDIHQPQSLQVLAEIDFDYLVVTLSPDQFDDEAYRQTYVEGLRHILAAVNRQALRKLFWVSSTSVYGQADGRWVDENSETEPTRFSGRRQLEAEKLLYALGDKACIVRFAGIYREGRHHLVEKLLAGELSGEPNADYYTNRIHVEDCAGVLLHLMQRDSEGSTLERVYIGCDSTPVLYSELIQWLAETLGKPLAETGEAATPRVGSKRCCNQRLLDTGFSFQYPSYREGFGAWLTAMGTNQGSVD